MEFESEDVVFSRRITVFVYGTLLDPAVMEGVTGRAYRGQPAVLRNYRRYRLHRRSYPGIVAEPGARVAGLVYRIDRDSLQALDRYEDACYERRGVTVEIGGEPCPAYAYVIPDQRRQLIDPRPWDPAQGCQRQR